jgi:hypothetical protein
MSDPWTWRDWGVFLAWLGGLGKFVWSVKRGKWIDELWRKPPFWQIALLIGLAGFIVFLFLRP